MKRGVFCLILGLFLGGNPLHSAAFLLASGTYIGDAPNDNRNISVTPSFPIVAVFIKGNAATGLMCYFSGMPVGDAGACDDTNGWIPDCIQSVGTGTFQIGTHANCNANGVTFHYLAFGTNSNNDLAVGAYVGNSTAGSNDNRGIVISPAFTPGLVWIINDVSNFTRWRTTEITGDNSCGMTAAATCSNADSIQAFNANGFEVGTANMVNANGVNYAYFALKAGTPRLWTFSYTGNAPTDDRSMTGAGFQPEWTWLKCTTTCAPVQYRMPTQTGDNSFPALLAQQANRIQTFVSDGFQIGSDNTVNQNNIVYYSWSIATQVAIGTGRRGRAFLWR